MRARIVVPTKPIPLALADLRSARVSSAASLAIRKVGRSIAENLKTLIRQALTAPIAVQEGAHSRRVSKLEGVVLRQLQGALKGNDRAALAIIKMAIQMGFLDDPVGNSSETLLSASDERILADLFARRKKVRR